MRNDAPALALALAFLAGLAAAGACSDPATGGSGGASSSATTASGGSAGAPGSTGTATGGSGGAPAGTGTATGGSGGASQGSGGASGGSGGASQGSGGASGGSGGASGGVGGGSGGSGGAILMGDACDITCATEKLHGCADEAACLATCHDAFASNHSCAPELVAYYSCYAKKYAELSSCSMPKDCVVPFGNLLLCLEGHCNTVACTHEENVCSCPAICNNHAVQSVCVGADCTCTVNGAVVGTCTDAAIPICGLKESCCTVLHFME